MGRALLRWNPDLLGDGFTDDDPLQKAIEAVLPEANPQELIELIESVPSAAAALLSSRRDILERPAFWQIASIDALRLISSLDVDQVRAGLIMTALVEAGHDECSAAVVDRFGIDPVVAALSELDVAGIRSKLRLGSYHRATTGLRQRRAERHPKSIANVGLTPGSDVQLCAHLRRSE